MAVLCVPIPLGLSSRDYSCPHVLDGAVLGHL